MICGWNLFPGPFAHMKVCHKIFIMLVAEKENLSLQLQRQFLCMRFANKFATYTCYSWMQWFSPIHHPNHLDDMGWGRGGGVALWMGVGERKGLRLYTLSLLYLLSDICTTLYKEVSRGEALRCFVPCFRCHTVSLYCAHRLRLRSSTNPYKTLHFLFK